MTVEGSHSVIERIAKAAYDESIQAME